MISYHLNTHQYSICTVTYRNNLMVLILPYYIFGFKLKMLMVVIK